MTLFEVAQQFFVATLDPPVAVAGNCMQALNVNNGNATSADLNYACILERSLNQIDGGSLHSKHLSKKFLRQSDVVAAQPSSTLEKPPRCAAFYLMKRLTGRRLLRLREQRQIE
jgi:hypothetical protein